MLRSDHFNIGLTVHSFHDFICERMKKLTRLLYIALTVATNTVSPAQYFLFSGTKLHKRKISNSNWFGWFWGNLFDIIYSHER